MLNRRHMWDDKLLPGADAADRRRGVNRFCCLFELLVTLENGTASVTVAGFASKPGVYGFDRPRTVYQVIMEAGGPSDYGSANNIHLTRIIDGVQVTETFNLKPTI